MEATVLNPVQQHLLSFLLTGKTMLGEETSLDRLFLTKNWTKHG